MKAEDFKPKDRVAYIPGHAAGDLNHKDVEYGQVSSQNGKNVFVRFDKQLQRFGWDGTTSQSCSPEDLVLLGSPKGKPARIKPYSDARFRAGKIVVGQRYWSRTETSERFVRQ